MILYWCCTFGTALPLDWNSSAWDLHFHTSLHGCLPILLSVGWRHAMLCTLVLQHSFRQPHLLVQVYDVIYPVWNSLVWSSQSLSSPACSDTPLPHTTYWCLIRLCSAMICSFDFVIASVLCSSMWPSANNMSSTKSTPARSAVRTC